MVAAELYRKTLVGYDASLKQGERVSLNSYCKTHHVSSSGLRYWMKKHSIIPPRSIKSTGSGYALCTNTVEGKSVVPTSGLIPFVVQPPVGDEKSTSAKPFLRDVDLTTIGGIVVRIKEISPVDLAELILSCNIR